MYKDEELTTMVLLSVRVFDEKYCSEDCRFLGWEWESCILFDDILKESEEKYEYTNLIFRSEYCKKCFG